MPDTRVLIVDEDRRIRRLVQRVADDLGLDAQMLDDASAFEPVYQSFAPDIIFLDLCMPGADGVELLRLLADHGSRSVIILMSGLGGRVVEAARTLGESLGLKMAPPLHKPLEFADVRARLAGRADTGAGALRRPLTREDLVRAIDNDELVVHFQPLIELGNDRLVAAEVLPRWRHPEHGLILPHRFLPLAEEHGLSRSLTMSVLTKAIHESKLWRDALPRFVLSIDLSRTLLEDLELPDRLEALLARHGLPAYNLMLEVPESRQPRDHTTALDVLTRLRLRGIRLALDAFGTGASALMELYRLPYGLLKIDPSFVGEVMRNEEAAAIVSSSIELGKRFGLQVVADGVESQAVLDWLTEHDCDLAQGVRIGPALDASRFLIWAEEWAHETDTEKATTAMVGDTLYVTGTDTLTAVNPALAFEAPSVRTGTGTRPAVLPAPLGQPGPPAQIQQPQPAQWGHAPLPPAGYPVPPGPFASMGGGYESPAPVPPDHPSHHLPMAAAPMPYQPPYHQPLAPRNAASRESPTQHNTARATEPPAAPSAEPVSGSLRAEPASASVRSGTFAQSTPAEAPSGSGYYGPHGPPPATSRAHSSTEVVSARAPVFRHEPVSESVSSRADTSTSPTPSPLPTELPSSQQTLQPGYRLHWYEIESVLGRGGFGVTYLAHDSNLGQHVAIKEFLPLTLAARDGNGRVHAADDESGDRFVWGLERFQTEARTLAQFRHPNIVRVYSVFEANGTAYMVMEYERGDSLHTAIRRGMITGEAQALPMLLALVDGLSTMHDSGFIHRDIKAGNIFVRNDGTPVLLDFGSARQAMGVATRTLTSFVSPGYTPFEQYSSTSASEKQGPWTDIYALAATFYRVVTGRAPIDAVARATALFNGGNDVYVPLVAQDWPAYSHGFLAAIDAALAFRPTGRPQDVGSWRAMLSGHAAVDSVPSSASRGSRATSAPHQGTDRGRRAGDRPNATRAGGIEYPGPNLGRRAGDQPVRTRVMGSF